jgi:hypothetical protein
MKNRLLFHQDLSLLVKSGLCPHKDYIKSHAHALKALKRLEKKAEDECFPFLRDPFDSYDCFTKIENDFRGMKNILIISEVFSKAGAGNASKNIFSFFRHNGVTKILLPFYLKEYDKNVLSYYNYLTIFYYFFAKATIRVISFFFSKNKFFFLTIFLDFPYSLLKRLKELLMIFIQIM